MQPANKQLLIGTFHDDVLLDVETEILENSFVTIYNDTHLIYATFMYL
jgi:hypothetical protein